MSSNVIWTAKDAAQATGGDVGSDWQASGISIDSRSVEKGDLFVALVSENGDGHDYVVSALEKGAVAAMVSRIPEGLEGSDKLLVVSDTLKGLEALGQAARKRTAAHVIAVTGSVGKTGTKEMLAAAFAPQGQTHAAQKSYNNHIGVPFTLSSMHEGTDYGVFEIGMNHTGEITPLTGFVKPDIAIITTVVAAHLAHFESVQDIADAKAEIFDGMNEGGIAILNRDNEWFEYLKEKAEAKNLKVVSFGEHKDADAQLIDCLVASNGNRVTADIMGEKLSYPMKTAGRHIAMNSLAVLLAVKFAGADFIAASKELNTIEPIAGRGKREYLDIGDPENPVTLIDESYNASPAAMSAAFKVLALIDPGRGGRRIAVLGDMLELGNKSAELHKDLALPLEAANVQLVYTCGQHMKNLHDNLPANTHGEHRATSQELAQIVPDVLTPGDVVMVKGSLGSQMGVVVEALRALPAGRNDKAGNTGSNKSEGDDFHAV